MVVVIIAAKQFQCIGHISIYTNMVIATIRIDFCGCGLRSNLLEHISLFPN